MVNALTIDVEDYFHPTEVQSLVPPGEWDSRPSRVEQATGLVLEALARRDVRATFFVLGWVARRFPELVRRIVEAGHEVGCHSHRHQLVFDLSPEQFRADTEEACRAIEDACGVNPRLYRAPSFSITKQSWWALKVLAEMGFTHDSSVVPVVHDRYGVPGSPRQAHVVNTAGGPIIEVPVASVALGTGGVAPVGGGAYLRLFPYRYTAAGLRRLNGQDRIPGCVYFHPWEMDPGQPRLPLGWVGRLRTYSGLNGMAVKLERLLGEFEFGRLGDVYPAEAFVQEHSESR